MIIAKFTQSIISIPVICTNCRARLNAVFYSIVETLCRSIGHMFQSYSSNTLPILLCDNDYQCFTGSSTTSFSRFRTTNISFINFDYPRKAITPGANHSTTQLMKPTPSCSIAAQSQCSLQTQSTNALFLVRHIPYRTKPYLQWFTRILKNCTCCYRCLIFTMSAIIQAFSSFPCFLMFTPWATKPIRPSKLKQVLFTCLFRDKPFFELHKISWVVFHTHIYYMLRLLQSSA